MTTASLAVMCMWIASCSGVVWYIAHDLTETHREDSSIKIGNVRAWYGVRLVSCGIGVVSAVVALALWVVS